MPGSLRTDEEPAESLWVRISWQINLAEVAVGFCYRTPGHEEEVDEAAFSQLKVFTGLTPHGGASTVVISAGGITHQGTGNPEVFWRVLMTKSWPS